MGKKLQSATANRRTNDFSLLSLFLSFFPSPSPGQQGQCAGEFYLGLIFSKQTRIGTLVLLLWMGTKEKKEKSSRKQRVWQQRCRVACRQASALYKANCIAKTPPVFYSGVIYHLLIAYPAFVCLPSMHTRYLVC